MQNCSVNQSSALLYGFRTDLRRQYGISGGESQRLSSLFARSSGANERRLYSQATIFSYSEISQTNAL